MYDQKKHKNIPSDTYAFMRELIEEVLQEEDLQESLRDWFKKEKWVRITTSGNIAGPCGTSKNKKNPDRCLPKAKAKSLTQSQRAATAIKKKKAGAKGKQVVPNTKKAKVKKEGVVVEKKDDRCTRIAKRKYDTWPSAYASGAVVRCRRGEIWKDLKEGEGDQIVDIKYYDNVKAVLATVGDEKVGALRTKPYKDGYQVDSVIVKPEYRGHGIAKEMYRAAFEELGSLYSDQAQTADAERVWDSFMKSGEAQKIDSRYKMVSEVGEASAKPYPYELKYRWSPMKNGHYYESEYRFRTDSNVPYWVSVMYDDGFLEIDFQGDAGYKVINKGELYRVMATIASIVKDVVAIGDVKGIRYTPTKKEGEQGNIRHKLYLKYITNTFPNAKVTQSSINNYEILFNEGKDDPMNPGILKKRLGKVSCTKVRKERQGLKDKGTTYAKALQRYLNYHCQ